MVNKHGFQDWMGTFPRANALWYPEEIERIECRLSVGKTINEIAKEHGRKPGSIAGKAVENSGRLRGRAHELDYDRNYSKLFRLHNSRSHCCCDCDCNKVVVAETTTTTITVGEVPKTDKEKFESWSKSITVVVILGLGISIVALMVALMTG